MKTAEQREKAFREDFAKLLEKHGAEFEVDYDGMAEIFIPLSHNDEGEIIGGLCIFHLS